MKQKIVIKVHMTDEKCRKKAMGIAAAANGVQSMAIEGDDKDQLVVVGDGVDAINLTSCLRRKVGSAQIVTVEAVGDDKKKGNTKPADKAVTAADRYPDDYCRYYRPPVVPPYAVLCYDDCFHSHADSWCTIM